MHILLIDDKKPILDFVTPLLIEAGHTVETASNGLDAYEKAQKTPFHLYIVDHLMPLMNGVILSKNLKQTPFCAQTPILFMTTQGKESVENLPEFNLFDDIITKPLNEAEFMSAVKRLIDSAPSKIAL